MFTSSACLGTIFPHNRKVEVEVADGKIIPQSGDGSKNTFSYRASLPHPISLERSIVLANLHPRYEVQRGV